MAARFFVILYIVTVYNVCYAVRDIVQPQGAVFICGENQPVLIFRIRLKAENFILFSAKGKHCLLTAFLNNMHFPPLTLWSTQHFTLHKTVFDKKLNSAAVACGGYTVLIDAIVYISSVDNGFHIYPLGLSDVYSYIKFYSYIFTASESAYVYAACRVCIYRICAVYTCAVFKVNKVCRQIVCDNKVAYSA